jgi:deazaflavin-dependent oxidoreductase (nitroreductase family)
MIFNIFMALVENERRDKMPIQDTSQRALPPTKSSKKDEQAPSFLIPIFKLPVFLYRLGLGWLLGKRFMQITHVGRHSGKVRRTVLAALRFDDKTKEVYAVSAWKGSDWYYNIQASPALLVQIGFVHYVPVQRTLLPEEIATTLTEYSKLHPIFSRMVCRIPGWKWDSTYEEFLDLARTLHGVAFRPK